MWLRPVELKLGDACASGAKLVPVYLIPYLHTGDDSESAIVHYYARTYVTKYYMYVHHYPKKCDHHN